MNGSRRYIVSGRVQGVNYRAATQDAARRLGLTGWVRNLPDGRVELVACGAEPQLVSLGRWLWQGPPAARVDAVAVIASEQQVFNDFKVLR